jgi:hypothetical protein
MTTLLSFGILYTIVMVSTPSTLNPTHLANPDHNTTHPETTTTITTPPPPPHDTDEHDNGACGNQTANDHSCHRSLLSFTW